MIYLAGPIDAVSDGEAKGWREEAIDYFEGKNIVTFSPAHAFSKGATPEKTSQAIIEVNNKAIELSSAVLACFEGKVSYGTPVEVELAKSLGIPVFSFGLNIASIYRHWINDYADQRHAMIAVYQSLVPKA